MTIVVKKVPKFLRGFVKFIFGIKSTQNLGRKKNHFYLLGSAEHFTTK